MQQHQKGARGLVRLLAFAVGLVLLVLFANTHLIQTDTITALMMTEMKSRSNIELALVGSSIVQDHFNAPLISEQTGLTAFSASVPGLSLPGDIAITRELYRTNSPAYTVLVLEPYNFDATREDPKAQYRMMPFLTGLRARLDYYLDASSEDGLYFDRFFMFRDFGVTSIKDFLKTLGLRYDTQRTYERLLPNLNTSISYSGSGFLRRLSEPNAEELVRNSMFYEEPPYFGYEYEIYDYSKDALLRYRDLCMQKGSELLIVISPNLTAHALAEPGFLPFSDSLMRFCSEQGIPCYNFMYAKPELLGHLDAYYYDLYHMNGEGADKLSTAFSAFFNRYTAGEDVSGLFYANRQEYLASIDFITNAWLIYDEESQVYAAESNRGSSVTPLYRFAAIDSDGRETILRDYAEERFLTADMLPEGCSLRVYAVPADAPDASPVYYDYTDKAALEAQL